MESAQGPIHWTTIFQGDTKYMWQGKIGRQLSTSEGHKNQADKPKAEKWECHVRMVQERKERRNMSVLSEWFRRGEETLWLRVRLFMRSVGWGQPACNIHVYIYIYIYSSTSVYNKINCAALCPYREEAFQSWGTSSSFLLLIVNYLVSLFIKAFLIVIFINYTSFCFLFI